MKMSLTTKTESGSRRFRFWIYLSVFSVLLGSLCAILLSVPLIEDWEDRFQSNFYLIRENYSTPEVSSFPLVVIRIDDTSLPPNSSRSPLDRRWLATLIDQVSRHRPLLIGLDILLDRAGKIATDQLLANAIQKSEKVILRDDPLYPALPIFTKGALDRGAIRFQMDSTGTIQSVCNAATSCQSEAMLHRKIMKHVQDQVGGDRSFDIPSSSWLKINFSHFVPHINAHEIAALPEKALQGKVVLIGAGFPDLYPLYRTPLSGAHTFLPQTEVLAQLLVMMAEKNYFHSISAMGIAVALTFILLFLSWILVTRGVFSLIGIGGMVALVGFIVSGYAFAFFDWELAFLLPFQLLLLFLASAVLANLIGEKFHLLTMQLQLKQAKIDYLTNELHSHHLFNELSRLSVMIRQSPDSAREYLIEFAEILRASLKYSDKLFVPVEEQIAFLHSFIRQQQIIHGERIHFQEKLTTDLHELATPWHSFFPLLENAVKYTEEFLRKTASASATIQIELSRSNGSLTFTVCNPFHPETKPSSTQTGIHNLRERLSLAYPRENYDLTFRTEQEEWIAQLRLPI